MDTRYEGDAVRQAQWGTERAVWLGEPGQRVFVMAHVPTQEPRGSVLVCSSLFTDTIFNYRREVEVSRILAEAGLLVARFHYRGTGHAEGDPLETTYETMVSDALTVTAYLSSIGGGPAPGVLGSRWGALVAAGVSQHFEASPVAVWEPFLEGRAFLREALQASGVAHLASQLGGPSPKQSLASQGVANILGFPLGQKLFESGQDLQLVGLLGSSPRRVLYLGPEKGGALAKAHAEAAESLTERGLDVTAKTIAGPKAWWFVDEVNPTPLDAASETASWFAMGSDR